MIRYLSCTLHDMDLQGNSVPVLLFYISINIICDAPGESHVHYLLPIILTLIISCCLQSSFNTKHNHCTGALISV